MTIEKFLQGPFPPEVWKGVGGGWLRGVVVIAPKGLEKPPERVLADRALRKYLVDEGGRLRPACVFKFDVVNGRLFEDCPIWKLKGSFDMAMTDVVYDGHPRRCVEDGLKPVWMDIVRLDVDLNSLDDLEGEVRRIRNRAAELKIDIRIMFSGAKGFHIWTVLPRPYPADKRPVLVEGLAALLGVSVDRQTLDVKRKLRVPYTVNTKTGNLAQFIDPATLEPIKPGDFTWPKPLPESLVEYLIRFGAPPPQPRQENRPAWLSPAKRGAKGVPGWVRRLIDYMCEKGELCHYARVAVVRSLLAAGWSVEQVVELFRRCARDFEERKTRYHVDYERKRLEAGEKPWRCSTVEQHCGGRDVPEGLCGGQGG
jgi:hypothetical protein